MRPLLPRDKARRRGPGGPGPLKGSRMDRRKRRINSEIRHQLIPVYGEVDWDWEDYLWVMIKRFPLPEGWNVPYCELLIEIPPGYPQVPPSRFYLPKRLRDRYNRMAGHYFEEPRLNPYSEKGWAWLCLHPRGWDPSKDTILTICEMIGAYLAERE